MSTLLDDSKLTDSQIEQLNERIYADQEAAKNRPVDALGTAPSDSGVQMDNTSAAEHSTDTSVTRKTADVN